MAEHAHGATLKTYFTVFGLLMLLTALTVYVSYADLGPVAVLVAVAIAGVKATLVILYFMHVRYESKLIALYAVSGFVFLLILVVLTMGEVAGRQAQPPDALGPPRAVPTAVPLSR